MFDGIGQYFSPLAETGQRQRCCSLKLDRKTRKRWSTNRHGEKKTPPYGWGRLLSAAKACYRRMQRRHGLHALASPRRAHCHIRNPTSKSQARMPIAVAIPAIIAVRSSSFTRKSTYLRIPRSSLLKYRSSLQSATVNRMSHFAQHRL